MKKIILIAASVAIAAVSTAKIYFAEKPVEKDIQLSIYKTASYTAPIYNGTYAKLKVIVVNEKGGKKDIVWQHIYKSVELKEFPDAKKPIQQKVTIPNVFENKDNLVVYYQLSYDTDGSVLNFQNVEKIAKGKNTNRLDIQI